VKPEVLFLAHRIPYPPDKGDKIRSWRLLQHLTQRFRVHLACFADDSRDLVHKAFLESLCESGTVIPLNPQMARMRSVKSFVTGEPFSFQYFRDTRMAAAVNTARARPLAAEIVFSSAMTPYIEAPIAGRKRIVDFCDADSEKWRQYAENASPPMAWLYAREAETLAHAETRIANWADASFAVSAEESAVFNARKDVRREVGWFANGVDTDYFDPACMEADEACASDAVFVGAMDYRANVEGVLDFVASVWPHIRAQKPDARFAIVGANPAAKIKALNGKDGVIVTGRVVDVRPWLAGAKVAIAPLRVARGVQNKVLEAMAMEKAVVASPAAMTGIAAPAGAALVSEALDEMPHAILGLLDDPGQRRAIGAAARRFVIDQRQWADALSPFDRALTALGL
jgi:sugar transferase (PEP-CTERM/EpsH1 system associated)